MIVGRRNAMLLAVVVVMLCLPALAAAAEPEIELRRNPFQRPAVTELISNPTGANEGEAAARDQGLRAVLVAGSKSVVNIGGVILQIGECTDTFCLLSVEEGKALISRNDKEVVLSLYEPDNSEQR